MESLNGARLPRPSSDTEMYLAAILEELQWTRRRTFTPEERKAEAQEQARPRTFADHVAIHLQPTVDAPAIPGRSGTTEIRTPSLPDRNPTD